MLTLAAQGLNSKFTAVLCQATGAKPSSAILEHATPALELRFPPSNAGYTPYIRMECDEAFDNPLLLKLHFRLILGGLDIFPLLQCLLVLLKERITITQHIEENILSAMHEALLNALIHGNLGQHSAYNDRSHMFAHFERISELLAQKKEPEALTVTLEILADKIQISIKDNGKGFSSDAIVPPGESALHGRGMSIIKECTDTVEISDGGSTITLGFAAGLAQKMLEERLASACLLIVEDVEFNRLIIKNMLEKRGFRNLHMAIDGVDAYEKTLTLRPDLVLLDLVLPRMDGYQYCQKIRQHQDFKDLPIVVQTILMQEDQRSRAFACGANDLVTKPINAYELVARISLLLEKQTLLRDLKSYQSRVRGELEQARAMQQSIVPSTQLLQQMEARYSLQVDALFQPSSEIGGDLWGMRMISEAECAIYIVDFSGHGITAALNAFRLQAMLQSMVVDATDPAAVLAELNTKLHELLSPGQFATMFYAVINLFDNQLSYAAAGATNPVVLRGQKGGIEWLEGRGLPLGASASAHYAAHTISFSEEDAILLYSDALIETPGAEGKCLSADDIATHMQQKSRAEAYQSLLEYCHTHAYRTMQDDLTLVLLSRKGSC